MDTKKIKFKNKILMIGHGAVAHCTLPILLNYIEIPCENITIIDFKDRKNVLKKWIEKGIKFSQERVTKENLNNILSKYLEKGGLLIDLAWNIDCCDIVKWCHDHEVLYVNTSVEQWDSKEEMLTKNPFEKSLYYRQMQLRELTKDWKDATTAIVDHGANPGLISHFTKQGLVDITHRLIKDKKVSEAEGEKLMKFIADQNFAELAMNLGVKVIHCSERDTQITNKPKEVDEFVGTWSIEGLREEGTATAEMGWGSHEKELPKNAHVPPYGPKNQIFLAQMGINTWVKSWIPGQEIIGMVIRHGEAFEISDRFTVWKDGKAIYRPTVHYAYMPCNETLASLHELRCRNYEMQSKVRILDDTEIVSGADALGALIMGHNYNSWWTGSILDIEEARKLIPGQNATTIVVALGVVTAVMWMIENPRKGLCSPNDLPYDYVLKIAKPWLGKFVSEPYDWTPLKNRTVFFKENSDSKADEEDPWQFKNFMFVP
ncbi:MAG: saccharopine dehydrogenase NADP-binding domain-containing protein [Nanoarchaeota archaeon]|nr:saccharopine dehydrogenase NADP-binding domain-containing protein [Nanoarchaeota archaeon]